MFTNKTSWFAYPLLWIIRPIKTLWAKAHMSQIKDRYYNDKSRNWEVSEKDLYRFISEVSYLIVLIGRNDRFSWVSMRNENSKVITHFGSFNNYVQWLSIITTGIEEANSVGNTSEAAALRKECRGKGSIKPITAGAYFWETYDMSTTFESLYRSLQILILRNDIITDKDYLDPDDTNMNRELMHIFPDVIGILEVIEGVLNGKGREV